MAEPVIADVTARFGWPKPHPANNPRSVDVPRIREALDGIDADLRLASDGVDEGRLPTVAALEAHLPSVAPSFLRTAFFDADCVDGSGSIFLHHGTSDPAAPGQAAVAVAGVTHFYTRSNKVLRPQQYGAAKGGNPAVNRAALQATLVEADWHGGREIDMGDASDVYEIDAGFTYYCGAKPTIRGSGATIKLNSSGANSQFYGLRLVVDGFGFDLEGFGVDANQKTTNPLCVENLATSFVEANVRSGRAVGLFALNGYRRQQSDHAGRGIWICGYFSDILAEDLRVKDMKMAAGAGVLGTAGVIGFYIGRRGASADDAPLHVDIVNPLIDGVSSEDLSYIHDQDGLSLLFPLPSSETTRQRYSVNVRGGRIKDAIGRGVKAQVAAIDVSGTAFESEKTMDLGPDDVTMMIDFQMGSGTARGVRGFAHNGAGWTHPFVGTARNYANGPMLIDGCYITGRGTPIAMDAIARKVADVVDHLPGTLTVNRVGFDTVSPNFIARYDDRLDGSNGVTVASTHARSIATGGAGILLEGSGANTVNAIFKDNVLLGSNRDIYQVGLAGKACTPSLIGSSADNRGFI